MLPEKIKHLFRGAEPTTRQAILRILELETQHLSKERPHILGDIRRIIEEEANRE
jgi:hypothetical protein